MAGCRCRIRVGNKRFKLKRSLYTSGTSSKPEPLLNLGPTRSTNSTCLSLGSVGKPALPEIVYPAPCRPLVHDAGPCRDRCSLAAAESESGHWPGSRRRRPRPRRRPGGPPAGCRGAGAGGVAERPAGSTVLLRVTCAAATAAAGAVQLELLTPSPGPADQRV